MFAYKLHANIRIWTGVWKEKFDVDDTRTEDFNSPAGRVRTTLMQKTMRIRYFQEKQLHVALAALPYMTRHHADRCEFVVLLPDQPQGFVTFQVILCSCLCLYRVFWLTKVLVIICILCMHCFLGWLDFYCKRCSPGQGAEDDQRSLLPLPLSRHGEIRKTLDLAFCTHTYTAYTPPPSASLQLPATCDTFDHSLLPFSRKPTPNAPVKLIAKNFNSRETFET